MANRSSVESSITRQMKRLLAAGDLIHDKRLRLDVRELFVAAHKHSKEVKNKSSAFFDSKEDLTDETTEVVKTNP